MKKRWETFLRRYGQTVEVSEQQCRAILYPLRRKNGEPAMTATPLGAVDQRVWVYLGPAETKLHLGQRLKAAGQEFQVQQAAVMTVGGQGLYCRAVLQSVQEAAE